MQFIVIKTNKPYFEVEIKVKCIWSFILSYILYMTYEYTYKKFQKK